MANVIEQIVQPASFGSQTIEMNVRSNERGPQGEQGEPGDAATINAGAAYTIEYGQQPQVMNSGTSSNATFDFYIPEGKPGAVHYTAGPGITITDDNRIEATGEMAVYWGDLVGSMNNQTDLKNALNAKQDKLTAGTNITISSNTISAKGYSAGTGLNLSNNGEFSVDTNAIQTKLTAGSNVQINAGTISATDTTYSNFIGADGGSGGSAGLVPAPVASDNVKVLQGNGTWGAISTSNLANSAVATNKIADSAVTTAKIDDGAVTASKIDYTSIPDMVTADFGDGSSTATSRTILKQLAVSGFDTGWQYMCYISVGLMYAYGNTGAIALMDLTIPDPLTDITSNSRLRANNYQTTISYCIPFTPPASSFTLNLNGAGTDSGIYWENAVAYFVPIKPVSS